MRQGLYTNRVREKKEANSLWQADAVTHRLICTHRFLASVEASQEQADHSATVTTQWLNGKRGSGKERIRWRN